MTENYSGGTIDVSWQTAPWNRDGETIPKETANEDGNITMTELPEEVNTEELSDMKEEIIRTAVRNIGFSCSQIDEAVGCSNGYSANTLREEVPQWYNTVFKQNGKSMDKTRNDLLEDEYEYPEPEELESVEEESDAYDAESIADDLTPDEPLSERTQSQSDSPEPDSSEWQSYAVVGLLSFMLGLLWGGRDE